jgi:serine protease Do
MARPLRKGRWLAAPVTMALLPVTWWQPLCQAQTAVADVAERITRRAVYQAARSVVRVEWDQPNHRRTFVANGTVFDQTGRILTAGMPSQAATGRLRVIDHRDRTWTARWIGFDERSGLTLLAVEAARLEPPLVQSRAPRPGDTVFVVRSLAEPEPVKAGTFRELAQTVEIDGQLLRRLFEFAAPLSLGDAGALLTNEQGEMIGIVRGRIAHAEPNPVGRHPDSIGVAIPLETALRSAEQLARQGRLQRGYLGLVVEEFSGAKKTEMRVVEIAPGTPAEQAGLEVGDVIRGIQQRPIVGMEDLIAALEATAPGDRISLDVVRGGEEHRFDAVVGAFPEPDAAPPALQRTAQSAEKPILGLEAQDVDPALRRQLQLRAERGALVVRVLRNSPADRLGIRPLDVIVMADHQPVQSSADLADAVLRSGTDTTLHLQWMRGQRPLEGEATLAGPSPAASPERDVQAFAPAAQQRIQKLERRIEMLEEYIRELEQRLERQRGPSGKPPAAAPSDPAPVAPKE